MTDRPDWRKLLQWLERTSAEEIDPSVLYANGLIAKNDRLKVLGRGEVKGALSITAHAFSATAKSAIEAKGGKATVIVDIVEKEKA